MRWLALWVFVLGLTGCAPAEAQSCSRNCPVSEMDAQGCCPAPVKKSGGTTTSGASSPSGFGKRASSAGCKTGLVNEGGVCCWPGQASVDGVCIGTPTCPSGRVASGTTCVEPGCPSGQVKQSGGQCCWPGQGWSSSGGKCVGEAQCPTGYGSSGGGCVAPSVSGEAWVSPTLGTMQWIPAGSFTMGSPPSESGRRDDEVQHRVTLTQGFWMMEHEVTQGEWSAVMGSNPSLSTDCGPSCPVESVSWEDAVAFAKKVSARDGVSYRLPTESEWEYAARGGASDVYAGSESLDAVGWYEGNSGGKSHPVCGKSRNGYGLCDMSGNVWEWVADWYGGYPGGAVTDPTGAPSGSHRVIRGGSWFIVPSYARVAFRSFYAPSSRDYSGLGFRLSRSGP